jgi:signal transduction histidine kinase
MGLPQDQINRIFDKFYQVEDHMTRRHGGLGIGLSIAKALVETHGGRIWATSAGLNRGASFTIALPLVQEITVIR